MDAEAFREARDDRADIAIRAEDAVRAANRIAPTRPTSDAAIAVTMGLEALTRAVLLVARELFYLRSA